MLLSQSLLQKNTFDAFLHCIFLCLLHSFFLGRRQLLKDEPLLLPGTPRPRQQWTGLCCLRRRRPVALWYSRLRLIGTSPYSYNFNLKLESNGRSNKRKVLTNRIYLFIVNVTVKMKKLFLQKTAQLPLKGDNLTKRMQKRLSQTRTRKSSNQIEMYIGQAEVCLHKQQWKASSVKD